MGLEELHVSSVGWCVEIELEQSLPSASPSAPPVNIATDGGAQAIPLVKEMNEVT